MNDVLTVGDTSPKSHSQKDTNNAVLQSDTEVFDVSHENNEDKKENVSSTTIIKKKYRNILDSDSDEEMTVISSSLNKSDRDVELIGVLETRDENVVAVSDIIERRKKSRRLIDSDSDNDKSVVELKEDKNNEEVSFNENNILRNSATTKPSKSRFHTFLDLDSEVDDESNNRSSPKINDKNENFNESIKTKVVEKKNYSKISTIVDSESDYDNDRSSPEVKNKKQTSKRKKKVKADKDNDKSKFSTLVDTDSEDDNERSIVEESNQPNQNGISGNKSKKSGNKRTGSIRATKEEAMRVIHSETQRLIRSSEVSLPYHRPKQRSLQDFLNRKKFVPALPEGLTTAAKVKMSSIIVGKVLKEKEKEAELFYKSSESEDEEVTCIPENFTPTEDSSDAHVDQIGIEETQKIAKNDVQNAHNKKEIIQQGAVDIGVPRKLFADEKENVLEHDKSVNTENVDDEEPSGEDPKKKIKEAKHGLREGSLPRKLFTSEYAEGVDSRPKNDVSMTENINENSEIHKDVESENVDDGIDSPNKINELSSCSDVDENDLALKLPDSGLPDSCDENSSNIDAGSEVQKECAESSKISETPFISNKEYAKLNQREKLSKPHVVSDDELDTNDDSSEPAFGHVYGLPPPDIVEYTSISKKVCSMPTASNPAPKLRGEPGMMIDLSSDVKPNREGVKSLVDRFLRHTAVNKSVEASSTVTVLHAEKTPDGIKVVEEILPYKLPTTVVQDKELQKPGAKYMRLKNDLIQKMAQKRNEEWKLKENQEKDEINDDVEESYEDGEVKLADEEFEGSTESEPEENDMPLKKKKKKRKNREFADEEAEVSGEEEDEEEMDMSADEQDEEENMSASLSDSSIEDLDTKDVTGKKTKRLSRIVNVIEDDSLPEASLESGIERCEKILERTKTDIDIFEPEDDNCGWLSDTEAEFPPSQILPRNQTDARSQLCKTPLTAINVLRFVSPITQLTALNASIDSPKDSPATKDISRTSQGIAGFAEKTPFGIKESCDNEKRAGLQKKLFEDPAGTVNDEELMGLCSGKFTNVENDDRGSIDAMSPRDKVTETQLLDLCSGSFTSQALDFDKIENKPNVDETSQDIRLTLDDDSEASCNVVTSKETRCELATPWSFKVASSDDENEPKTGEKKKILKKKKVQKLDLSDDDDASEMSNDDDIIDTEYVDYDSEENEVPTRVMKKAAADFLEAEAELSESEWDSADEDEKDLDKLEFEAGDDEEFDEKQMRDQIGRIHARQVQDDDQREVRMLQELLFDDGDLHTDGSGRERKFKWKNIDQLGDDGYQGSRANDDDVNGEDPLEDDNDLEWRKERLEREKFIEDKMKSCTDEVNDELAVDSQVFKLGIKALKRGKISQCSEKEPEAVAAIVPRTVLDLVGSPSLGKNTRILHKAITRGSFLARGDECLARLAVHIKHSSDTTIVARKNPRNCVFTHISPSVAEAAKKKQDFSTEEDSTANSKAKKRKLTSGITPRSTKKAKVTRSTGKKLF